jgi:hypothetical protein
MKPDPEQQDPSAQARDGGSTRRISFRSNTPSRELLLVKFAFWAVVVGFFLLALLLVWGLVFGHPSTIGSAD